MKRNFINNNEISIHKLVFEIGFWCLLIVISIAWITDFNKVQNEKNPKFCIVNKTHEFEDGTVEECIGLGYKVYEYNRESINETRQFSPFYIKMKR